MNDLEKRMYFLVPYNISPIQQAIQAGHSMGEYALKYGRYDSDHLIWEFLEKWKTWIVLNGGTTNFNFVEIDDVKTFEGTLNQIENDLEVAGIEYSRFIEPDLNNALSAVCLIVDERVFNREDYPDFKEWALDAGLTMKEIREEIGNYYECMLEYKQEVGEEIIFLKELLNTKKLA
jgi:hypothetical protein